MSATPATTTSSRALTAAPRALVDYDFPSTLEVPVRPRILLWLLAGILGFAAVAMGIGKIDIVVSANGRIVTEDNEIVVQPLETAVVRTIAVKMGQKVKAGQVVATLDPTFPEADKDELDVRLRNLQATCDRLQAEIQGGLYNPPQPNAEAATQLDIFRRRHDEYSARLDAADRKVRQLQADLEAHRIEAKGLTDQIELSDQANAIYQQLVAANLASKLKLIETSQRLVDAKSRLDTNQGEQKKLTEQVAAAEAERSAFTEEWRRKLAEEMAQARSDKGGVEARLTKAKLRQQLAVLTSPRDATVLEVSDRPPGSVIREAEPLMRLVPSDAPLVAETQIDTRDVARVHVGDRVTLKFEALPWQQFGLAYGVLQSLTPDTVEDRSARQTEEDVSAPDMKSQAHATAIHYRARIRLTENRMRNLPADFELRPGMRLVADINIGRRSILNYVLNPITRIIDESLREP